ncbi:hypothetical protein [Vibrio mediterranei]|uniref:hypothetical protein n=1 Tax=Vibrio mediterranei TaxID=689 RepID=UPI0038CE33C4
MIKECLQNLISLEGVVQHSKLDSAPGDVDFYVPIERMKESQSLLLSSGFTFSKVSPTHSVALKYEGAKLYIFDLINDFNVLFESFYKFSISESGNRVLGESPKLAKSLKLWIKNGREADDDLLDFLIDSDNTNGLDQKKLISKDLSTIRSDILKFRAIIRIKDRVVYRKSHLNRGTSLAFLGPDGSGKSYIIDLLSLASYSKTQYMGDWFFTFQKVYNLLFKIPTPYNRFVYFLFYIENLLRGVKVRLWKFLGFNVLIDRFPGTNRSSIYATGVLAKVNRFFYKYSIKPDFLVVLTARPEVVYARKQELSIDEIDKCQKSIIRMVSKDKHIVCNTEQLDETLNSLLELLYPKREI